MEFFAEKYYKMLQDVKCVGVKTQPDKLIEENSIKCKEDTLFIIHAAEASKPQSRGQHMYLILKLDMLHWLLLESR